MDKVRRQRLMEQAALGVFRLGFMLSFLRSRRLSVDYSDYLMLEMDEELRELDEILEQFLEDETPQ